MNAFQQLRTIQDTPHVLCQHSGSVTSLFHKFADDCDEAEQLRALLAPLLWECGRCQDQFYDILSDVAEFVPSVKDHVDRYAISRVRAYFEDPNADLRYYPNALREILRSREVFTDPSLQRALEGFAVARGSDVKGTHIHPSTSRPLPCLFLLPMSFAQPIRDLGRYHVSSLQQDRRITIETPPDFNSWASFAFDAARDSLTKGKREEYCSREAYVMYTALIFILGSIDPELMRTVLLHMYSDVFRHVAAEALSPVEGSGHTRAVLIALFERMMKGIDGDWEGLVGLPSRKDALGSLLRFVTENQFVEDMKTYSKVLNKVASLVLLAVSHPQPSVHDDLVRQTLGALGKCGKPTAAFIISPLLKHSLDNDLPCIAEDTSWLPLAQYVPISQRGAILSRLVASVDLSGTAASVYSQLCDCHPAWQCAEFRAAVGREALRALRFVVLQGEGGKQLGEIFRNMCKKAIEAEDSKVSNLDVTLLLVYIALGKGDPEDRNALAHMRPESICKALPTVLECVCIEGSSCSGEQAIAALLPIAARVLSSAGVRPPQGLLGSPRCVTACAVTLQNLPDSFRVECGEGWATLVEYIAGCHEQVGKGRLYVPATEPSSSDVVHVNSDDEANGSDSDVVPASICLPSSIPLKLSAIEVFSSHSSDSESESESDSDSDSESDSDSSDTSSSDDNASPTSAPPKPLPSTGARVTAPIGSSGPKPVPTCPPAQNGPTWKYKAPGMDSFKNMNNSEQITSAFQDRTQTEVTFDGITYKIVRKPKFALVSGNKTIELKRVVLLTEKQLRERQQRKNPIKAPVIPRNDAAPADNSNTRVRHPSPDFSPCSGSSSSSRQSAAKPIKRKIVISNSNDYSSWHFPQLRESIRRDLLKLDASKRIEDSVQISLSERPPGNAFSCMTEYFNFFIPLLTKEFLSGLAQANSTEKPGRYICLLANDDAVSDMEYILSPASPHTSPLRDSDILVLKGKFFGIVIDARKSEYTIHCSRSSPNLEISENVLVKKVGNLNSDLYTWEMLYRFKSCRLSGSIISGGERGNSLPPNETILSHICKFRSYNASQIGAITTCCGREGVQIIHGPPGTGKTQTILGLIDYFHSIGRKVVVCSHSNGAVNEIVRRLKRDKLMRCQGDRLAVSNGNVIRVGVQQKLSPDIQDTHIDKLTDAILENEGILGAMNESEHPNRWYLQKKRREARRTLIGGCSVLCCTLSTCKELPYACKTAIIDESSQVIEPTSLIPLALGCTQVILVGDHKQLSATVLSRECQKKS